MSDGDIYFTLYLPKGDPRMATAQVSVCKLDHQEACGALIDAALRAALEGRITMEIVGSSYPSEPE